MTESGLALPAAARCHADGCKKMRELAVVFTLLLLASKMSGKGLALAAVSTLLTRLWALVFWRR